jgi:hypothetical protein
MLPVSQSVTIPRTRSDPTRLGVVEDAHSIRKSIYHSSSIVPKTRIAKTVQHPATMFLVFTIIPLNTLYVGTGSAVASIGSMRKTASERLVNECYQIIHIMGHSFILQLREMPHFLCQRELGKISGCVWSAVPLCRETRSSAAGSPL